MKTFVTGSSGFIGQWTVETLLRAGHEVHGLDRKPFPLAADSYVHHQGDLLDRDWAIATVQKAAPEALIHLAARIDLDGKSLAEYAINIEGVRHVVAAIRATSSIGRALFTSSQLVCRIGHVPISPTEYCPDTVYGQSKVQTEHIVREENGGGVTWAICRPTTVWGPRMSDHYRRMIHYIEHGRYFHVGRSKLYKSYAYAGNIAWQYLRLLEAPAADIHGQVFYLADYQPLSLRDYTDQLSRQLGAKPIPTVPPWFARVLALTGDIVKAFGLVRFPFNSFRLRNILTEYICDLKKTQAVCGPLPFTFEEGVRATVAWYRNTPP